MAQNKPGDTLAAGPLLSHPGPNLQQQRCASPHLPHVQHKQPVTDALHPPQTHLQHQHEKDMHSVPTQASKAALRIQDSAQPAVAPGSDLVPTQPEDSMPCSSRQCTANASGDQDHEKSNAPGQVFATGHDDAASGSADNQVHQVEPDLLLTQELTISDSDPDDEQQFPLHSCSPCFDEPEEPMQEAYQTMGAVPRTDSGPDPSALKLDLSPVETVPKCALTEAACSGSVAGGIPSRRPRPNSALPHSSSTPPLNNKDLASPRLSPFPATQCRTLAALLLQQQQQQQQGNVSATVHNLCSAGQPCSDEPAQQIKHHASRVTEPSHQRTPAGSSALQQLLLQSHASHAAVTGFLWSVLRSIVPQVYSQ